MIREIKQLLAGIGIGSFLALRYTKIELNTFTDGKLRSIGELKEQVLSLYQRKRD